MVGSFIFSPQKSQGQEEWCGDTICNNGENCDTCSGDCGCGGGTYCNGGACIAAPYCGDGSCNEDVYSCCTDCGGCNGGYHCESNSCVADPVCGNSSVESGEGCDDGDNSDSDGCSSICSVEWNWTCNGSPSVCQSCGNSTKEGTETCDDGNGSDSDGCSSGCSVESGWACNDASPSVCHTIACGDGIPDSPEGCDDGGTSAGDGCSDTCAVESGYGCTGTPSVCSLLCGNGGINDSEACDDGDTSSGDGCSDICAVETDWTCNGAPSVCQKCGNSTKEGTEACDDGDIDAGDGCSATCTVESGYGCTGTPSVCTILCGNGTINSAEIHYLMNDNAATTSVVNTQGNYTGTAQRNTSLLTATGLINGALNFNGTTDYINIPGSSDLLKGNTWTVSFWVYISSANSASAMEMFSKRSPSNYGLAITKSGSSFVLYAASSSNRTFDISGDSGNAFGSINYNAWNLITIAKDGTAWRSYANANLGSTITNSAKLWDNSQNLAIGKNNVGLGTFKGLIDDVRVYETTLSQDEITALYNSGTGTESNLAGEDCDDGGTSAGDGCSATCAIESGWACDGASPSSCHLICSDGVVEGAEECDDSNVTNGDGCSSTCTWETPSAPTGFAGTPTSGTAVTWSWASGGSSFETGFKIFSAANALLNTAASSATSWAESGLTEGTSYSRYITSINNTASSSHSSTISVVTLPTAPSSLSASSQTVNSITWSWTDNSNGEEGYRIYNGAGSLIGTVGANVHTYTDTGLTEGSSYTRNVVAFNNSGTQESASSGNVSSATLPTAPSAFYGTVDSGTAITWRWTDNSTHEDGFKIYDSSDQLKGTVGANVSSWQETGLTAGETYARHVVAYKESSNSSSSNTDSVTTTTTPTAPSGFSGSAASASAITWIWTDNSSNETGFKLYDSHNTLIATISADATTYTETGLTKNTAYSRYLKAYNSYGESAATDNASASTNDSPPDPPSLLIGSAVSSTKIDWSWSDNSNDETGFRIYDGSGNLIGSVTTNVSSYTETGLTKNTSYTRYVKAYNGIGSSVASSSYAETTKSDAPSSPTLSVPASSALLNTLTPTFTFKRSTDTDDGIDGYVLIFNQGESNEKSVTIANINDGGSQSNSYGVVTGASSTISFALTDATLLKEGANTWKVKVTDLGSNSSESDARAFVINLKLPVVDKVTFSNAISSDDNEIVTSASSGDLIISLSSSSGLKELKVNLGKQLFIFGAPMGTQNILVKTFELSGKNNVITVPLSGLQTGKYQLLLDLEDVSGNVTDWSRTINVVTSEEAQKLDGTLARTPADAKKLADEGKTVSRTPLNMRLDGLSDYGKELRLKQAGSTDQFLERYLTSAQVDNLDTKIAVFSRKFKNLVFNAFGRSSRTIAGILSQPVRHRLAMMGSAVNEASESGRNNRMELALKTQHYFEVLTTPVQVAFQRVGTTVRVAFDVMSGNHEGALKIANVQIESIGKTQASISWKTNRVARGKINYGSSPSYGKELFMDDYTTNHHAVLTGLEGGQKYFFEVLATDLKSQNAFDAFYSFDTPEQ